MTTNLQRLREAERDNPPSMYACARVGHVVTVIDGTTVCVCCLQEIPTENELREASLQASVERLRSELEAVFVPPLLRFAGGLDRLLRRWPWLYRKLEG